MLEPLRRAPQPAPPLSLPDSAAVAVERHLVLRVLLTTRVDLFVSSLPLLVDKILAILQFDALRAGAL